jgi:hypothetical protein
MGFVIFMSAKVWNYIFAKLSSNIKLTVMKRLIKFWLLIAAFFGFGNLNAQFDDVYFDPNQRNVNNTYNYGNDSYSTTETYTDPGGNTYITNNYFNNAHDDDYFYSQRLRRFYQPVVGISYFDPWYVTPFYYSAWNVYYNPWAWNRWGRRTSLWVCIGCNNWGWGWNAWGHNPWAWNSWGMGWNSWGMGWNTWGMGWNSWGMGWGGGWMHPAYGWGNPWGWNAWGHGGWGNPYWGWRPDGGGSVGGGTSGGTVYGPRKGTDAPTNTSNYGPSGGKAPMPGDTYTPVDASGGKMPVKGSESVNISDGIGTGGTLPTKNPTRAGDAIQTGPSNRVPDRVYDSNTGVIPPSSNTGNLPSRGGQTPNVNQSGNVGQPGRTGGQVSPNVNQPSNVNQPTNVGQPSRSGNQVPNVNQPSQPSRSTGTQQPSNWNQPSQPTRNVAPAPSGGNFNQPSQPSRSGSQAPNVNQPSQPSRNTAPSNWNQPSQPTRNAAPAPSGGSWNQSSPSRGSGYSAPSSPSRSAPSNFSSPSGGGSRSASPSGGGGSNRGR